MDMMVFVWLMFAIIIILFTILQMKLNPAIALVLGSIFMGLAAGLGAPDTNSFSCLLQVLFFIAFSCKTALF